MACKNRVTAETGIKQWDRKSSEPIVLRRQGPTAVQVARGPGGSPRQMEELRGAAVAAAASLAGVRAGPTAGDGAK